MPDGFVDPEPLYEEELEAKRVELEERFDTSTRRGRRRLRWALWRARRRLGWARIVSKW